MNIIRIDTQVIELYKIIKYEGFASSGSEAKEMVAQGLVLVNGQLETRKRRKLKHADVITVDGVEMLVQCVPSSSED